jgi:hypothetical protein
MLVAVVLGLYVFKGLTISAVVVYLDENAVRMLIISAWMLLCVLNLIFEFGMRMAVEKQKFDSADWMFVCLSVFILVVGSATLFLFKYIQWR